MLGLPLKFIIIGKRKGLVVGEASWKLPDDIAGLVKSTHAEGQYFFGPNSARLSPSGDVVSARGYYTFLLREGLFKYRRIKEEHYT